MKEKELERNFKALANRRRLAILVFVKKKKEAPVWDISEEIKLSFKATSKHLNILATANILEKEQRSLQMFYRIPDNLPAVVRSIISFL